MSSPLPLDRLAAAARREQAPAVDVAQQVLHRLSAAPARADRTFVVAAIGGAAVSFASLTVAAVAWGAWNEALAGLLLSFAVCV